MEQWQRIGGDDFANYGKRSITFASPRGTYRPDIDDSDQDRIRARHVGGEGHWHIERKETYGGIFRLSGLARDVGGLLGDAFWFELLLTSPSTITYWGDRVIAREDKEV